MAGGGKIDCYIDCNSPYSLFALTWLRKNRGALSEHGIEIEVHPIFLGGINVGSGNKPPWTLEAKANYGKFDRPRAEKYFGTGELKAPSFFPILSILPMRCMLYVKANYPRDQYETQFESLWQCYWREGMDISKPEIMGKCLSRNFSEDEVKKILEGATSKQYKQKLTDEVTKLVEKGAFGAPWFLVKNRHGNVEPFFGSDRFAYMLQYLEVPFTDITIRSPKNSKL